MTTYRIDTDIIIDIYRSGRHLDGIGLDSKYADIPHPGTANLIHGWKWNQSSWPSDNELEAIGVSPSIWDPSTHFLTDAYWQSGIGSDRDLLLFSIDRIKKDDQDKWVPRVNHGYFYSRYNEDFIFSDDVIIQDFFNNQLESGVQYITLEHLPKPGIPIHVKRYQWDRAKKKYITNLQLDKKDTLTGVTVDGIEQDTLNDDETIAFHNIDSTKREFYIDYDYDDVPRVYLNNDYSETSVLDNGEGTAQTAAGGYSDIFYNIAYNGTDLWCAVGQSGEIQTSPDGETWTAQTAAGSYSGTFRGVAHNGTNLWCAVGSSGEIQTSPDGETWTAQTAAGSYSGTFLGVAYNGTDLWCAVGSLGEIQTSPDGEIWTAQTAAGGYSGLFLGVAYNGTDLWCAVGQSGEIQTSPDGETWTAQTAAGGYSGMFQDIAHNGTDLWCAVGQSGEIQTSPDGETWTAQTAAGSYSGYFHDIAHNGTDLWCAVGQSGEIQTFSYYAAYSDYEFIGVADGKTREFYFKYSPVDPSGLVDVISCLSSGIYDRWTQIDTHADFTEGPIREFKLDHTLGVVSFGTYSDDYPTGSGAVPSVGHSIFADYTKGMSVEYEPEYSRDTIFGYNANLNPLNNAFDSGFIFVGPQEDNPASIVLTCDYTLEGSIYQSSLAGPPGNVIATVRSVDNILLPNQKVYFEFVNIPPAALGSLSALTNANGQAIVQFLPPSDIGSMGVIPESVLHSGLNSTIILASGLFYPSTNSGVLLYEIYRSDFVYGIPASGEDNHYNMYFNEEDIQVTPVGVDIYTQSGLDFESFYRNAHDIPLQTTYDDTDEDNLLIGRKVVSYGLDISAVHPHSGSQDDVVHGPIFPSRYSNLGTSTDPLIELVYDTQLELQSYEMKNYFVVAESKAYIRAYIIHSRTGKYIYSNTITVDIDILDKNDGILNYDNEVDIPDGLFTEHKNIANLSDSYITSTYASLLNDIYLEDRLVSGELGFKALTLDDSTEVLLHFDGNYDDEGPHDVTLYNNGTLFVDNVGGQCVYTPDRTSYIYPSGISNYFPIDSGTIEFSYRAPYAGYPLGDGQLDTFCAIMGQDEKNEFEGVWIFAYDGYGAGYPFVGVNYYSSGLTVGNIFQRSVPISETLLADNEWHQIKVGWSIEEVTSNSGLIDLDIWIDNRHLLDSNNLSIGGFPSPILSGFYEYIAGEPTYAAIGYHDEFRLTSGSQEEYSWQPDYVLEYEDFISWFRRTRAMDSNNLGLNTYTFSGDVPCVIPVGYRIKDDDIDVSSTIDHRVFLDVNDPLPSGAHNVYNVDTWEEYY